MLLTSPDALIDNKTGELFDGIEEALNYFINLNEDNVVITTSLHKEKLAKIPEGFNPIHIRNELRGSPKLINYINEKMGYNHPDIIILGANRKDLVQAANSKLLLLSARFSSVNNPTDLLFSKNYGIQISDTETLKLFFERFLTKNDPWYFKLDVTTITTIFALTNANTFHQGPDLVELNKKFQACLKEGHSEYISPFMNFFLVSLYKIFQFVNKVDIWTIYPTSTGASHEDLG